MTSAVIASGLALSLGAVPAVSQEIDSKFGDTPAVFTGSSVGSLSDDSVVSSTDSSVPPADQDNKGAKDSEDIEDKVDLPSESDGENADGVIGDVSSSTDGSVLPSTDSSIADSVDAAGNDAGMVNNAPLNGWVTDSSGAKRYYKDGAMLTGEANLRGDDPLDENYHWYYFDDVTGAMTYGWKWIESGSKWVYYKPGSGWMTHGESCNPSGNNDSDASYWYYFDDFTGATTYGWKWVESGSKWVYYQPTYGWMTYGESFNPCGNNEGDASHWYYFDDVTGATTYGWKWVASGSKWVYYQPYSGCMTYGESYNPCGNNYGDASHWYYFDNYTGATTYGYKWISDPSDGYWGGKTVFYDRSMGWMLYGWQNISGTWNYFNRYTGRQCSSTNAAWSATQWLNWAGSGCGATNDSYVMVDKVNLRCMTFERDNGVWVPTNDFLCSVAGSNGNHGAGTVEGFWHLGLLTNAEKGITNGSLYDHGPNGFGAQIDNFVNSGSTGLVWSGGALAKIENDKFAKTMYRYHYVQDQGIHSTVGGDHPEQLGQRNTDGCVRLGYTDCRWIFNCIPMYTTIRIYSDVRF